MKKILQLGLFLACAIHAWAAPTQTSDFIRIDQFGYRPNAVKVAVIIRPQEGFDKDVPSIRPSVGANQYQLRKWDNDEVVFQGTIKEWNNGTTDASSGDKAWWFDFSSVKANGNYYVFDVGNNVGSFKFEINENVYNNVLRAAVRMFYYNRCNAEKRTEYAGLKWQDKANFVGAGQDTEARSVTDRNNATTAKDLSGGWWDAGDYNKYTTFAREAVHTLLSAYEQNPKIWGDNYRIPESGNGIPDIIDEIKWELDWLKKMQLPDGSGLLKVGSLTGTDAQGTVPPSTDTRKRYYIPESCTSASIALASMFAHAAYTFGKVPALKSYADDLQQRAIKAYAAYENVVTKQGACDDLSIQAGDADLDANIQEQIKVQAAVYLFAITNDVTYKNVVDANYTKNQDIGWWGPYRIDVTDALLFYTTLSNAAPSVSTDILSRKRRAGNQDFYQVYDNKDPYRSFMRPETYHWSSLKVRSDASVLNSDMLIYKLDTLNKANYEQRYEDMMHYFHGVNPFNMVYLTNMYAYGAEKSLDEMYHVWFKNGSDYDNVFSSRIGPPPGYVPGGPNKAYNPAQGGCILTPPCFQPEQKSFRAWNTAYPDASWSVTEPGIYYQASYIKALSRLVTNLETSNTVIAATKEEATIPISKITVSPNPCKEDLNIHIIADKIVSTDLILYDSLGKIVSVRKIELYVGGNTFKVDTKQLTNGFYIAKVGNSSQRFVKQ